MSNAADFPAESANFGLVNLALGMLRYSAGMKPFAPPASAREIVPRAPRREVNVAARIEGPTIQSFSTRVKNISSSGMLLSDSGELQVGDVLYATLPGMAAVLCMVARLTKGGGAGIRFETPAASGGYWDD
jgi:hypothetical protein